MFSIRTFSFLSSLSLTMNILSPESSLSFFDSKYRYPPPIIVKHHSWFFDDADFFIIVRGIVFGLHQWTFRQGLYFRNILDDPTIVQGVDCLYPLPFDKLLSSEFMAFLQFLYYPECYSGTKIGWMNLRRLAIDWGFPHQAAISLRRLMAMRQNFIPITHRTLLKRFVAHEVMEQLRLRRQFQNTNEEDDSIDLTSIGDEWF